MTVKKSNPKSALEGFNSWLQEQFPGRRLAVTSVKEGEEHLCTLKFRGHTLAQARAKTLKAATEKAASEGHKRCQGDPAKLREMLRGNQASEFAGESSSEQPAVAEPPKLDAETKKTKKLVTELAKQLEQTQSLAQSQAKDIKRLKRELADLQNLNLQSKLDNANVEISRLRSSLQTQISQDSLTSWLAQLNSQEQRLSTLESLERKKPAVEAESSSRIAPEKAFREFKDALQIWAPEYAEMSLPIVASSLAFRLLLVPRLGILRALQQVWNEFCRLSVLYVDPGWMTAKQALTRTVQEEIARAIDTPEQVHILVFDGLNSKGLNTWARGLCHWAQELTTLAEFENRGWPMNLRVCFIPSTTCISGLLNQNIAAIPPAAEKDCGVFGRAELASLWQADTQERYCCRKSLKSSLKKLGHLHLYDEWEQKLLRLWPAAYESPNWWASNASSGLS